MCVKNIQIVVLNRPALHFDDSFTRDIFGKMIGLRMTGYGKEYAQGVLPLDANDFIGSHIIFCEKENETLKPIVSYRFVMKEWSDHYNVEFAGLGVVRSSKADPHEQVLRSIMNRCEQEKKRLAYCGSWTIHPDTRKDDTYTKDLRDLVLATHHFFMRDHGIDESTICAVLRFKTQYLQMRLGYKPLEVENVVLPSFKQQSLMGEPVIMLHMSQTSQEVLNLSARFSELWENRIEIGDEAQAVEQTKKAA